jgi:hypothetical protein
MSSDETTVTAASVAEATKERCRQMKGQPEQSKDVKVIEIS